MFTFMLKIKTYFITMKYSLAVKDSFGWRSIRLPLKFFLFS